MERLGCLPTMTIGDIDRHDHNLQRCNGYGPNDAIGVMMLLDGSRRGAADANAIAAHHEGMRCAIDVEIGGVHGRAILRAQFKHVPDLDAAHDPQRFSAPGTRISLTHQPHVDVAIDTEIALVIGIDVVHVRSIRPYDDIAHAAHLVIRQNGHPGETNRSRKPLWSPSEALDGGTVGETYSSHLQVFGELGLVHLSIAAHQHPYHTTIGFVEERLDDRLAWHAEVCGHGLNGRLARRLHRGERLQRLAGRRYRIGGDFGALDVGRIATTIAYGDGILTGVGEHHKFLRITATDGARLRLNRRILQATAGKDGAVGVIHFTIADIGTSVIAVEAIGIFHDELAPTHQPKPGSDLIAKFRLDLVEHERQLAIGADFPSHQIGDHFLMGGSQAKIALVAIFQPHHLLAHEFPPPALLPQFRWLDRRQQQLLRPGAVHLFANDLRY